MNTQESSVAETIAPVAMSPNAQMLAQLRTALKSPPIILSVLIIAVVVFMALFAPWLAQHDPLAIAPSRRFAMPGAEHWMGTDAYGRDVFARLVYGARVSLIVGAAAAAIALSLGLMIGVLAGYFRLADAIIMRVMDGIMAIPSILLAIALVSLTGGTLWTVLIAIIIPEIPRVVRLVRSVILNVREEPFVEAAQTLGSPVRRILWRHMIPSTLSPLVVQGTFIFAAAILTEATLSFLGAGLPTETPSWGNMMAEGRTYFQLHPRIVLIPGIALALTLLSVNLLGDVLRDLLDPRMKQRT